MRCRFVPVREHRCTPSHESPVGDVPAGSLRSQAGLPDPQRLVDVRERVIAAAIEPHKIAKSRKSSRTPGAQLSLCTARDSVMVRAADAHRSASRVCGFTLL
jgi:hypothetical protein